MYYLRISFIHITYYYPLSCLSAAYMLMCRGPYTKRWVASRGPYSWRKLSFPQQPSISNSFSASSEMSWILHAGNLASLNSCSFGTCCLSHCKCTGASVLQCLEKRFCYSHQLLLALEIIFLHLLLTVSETLEMNTPVSPVIYILTNHGYSSLYIAKWGFVSAFRDVLIYGYKDNTMFI